MANSEHMCSATGKEESATRILLQEDLAEWGTLIPALDHTQVDQIFVKAGHVVRIYPTPKQERYLESCCHVSRFSYNKMLHIWEEMYAETGKANLGAVRKQFNIEKHGEYPWATEVAACVAANAAQDLLDAFTRFFKGQNKYPKYKKRKVKKEDRHHSKPYTQMSFGASNGVDSCTVEDRGNPRRPGLQIILPRGMDTADFGLIKMAEPPRWDGPLHSVSISKDVTGRWFASLLIKVPLSEFTPESEKQAIGGVDIGARHLATESDGTMHEVPAKMEALTRRKAKHQRKLRNGVQGSNSMVKKHARIKRLDVRITDTRSDMVHKTTRECIDKTGCLGVENVHVAGLLKNPRVAHVLQQVALGEVARQLRYKGLWRATDIVEASRWFPSSKRCCACGHVNSDLKSGEIWVCPHSVCAVRHHRDRCAAQNLEDLAVAVYGDRIGNYRASSARINAGGEYGSASDATAESCNQTSLKPEFSDGD